MGIFDSVESLFNHILSALNAAEKEGTLGASGYVTTEKEGPQSLTRLDGPITLENECDGENVSVRIEDETWRKDDPKKYAIYVTKRYYVRAGEKSTWTSRWGNLPSSEEQIDTLIKHVCELHGKGIHSLFYNEAEQQAAKLLRENEELKQRIRSLEEELNTVRRELDDLEAW